jgi:thiamine kinase-like enzyme
MKKEIKDYFESLNPKEIGLKKLIRVSSVKELGMGKNNLNFLVKAGSKNFIFRLNMLVESKTKSRSEFNALKITEELNVGPKAFLLDESRKVFDSEFIILEYLEGTSLDKIKYKIGPSLMKKVAYLCSSIHNIPIKGRIKQLEKDEETYRELLKNILSRLDKVNKLWKNKFALEILTEGHNHLKNLVQKYKIKHPLVLAHGDICEQNIIRTKKGLRLIDFESLGLTEPAAEIAYILTQFGEKELTPKNQEEFLRTYLKQRKDPTLIKRLKVYIPLKNFSDLLWAIEHVLKIKNKLLHNAYLEKNDIKQDIKYVKKVFKRCLNDKTISQKYKQMDITKDF